MTAISSRKSVLAVMAETTEGTLEQPSGATKYIAMQDDFELTPSISSLENAELKSSIAPGKPIPGAEEPSGSMSHYLRGSGVEGQAPAYRELVKAAFGTETVNATERTTTSGSSVSSIVLGAGGSDFARGRAVLVKDGVNGRSIRAIHSVSSNTLTPGFNLAFAPATGVNVGKCVSYEPANEGHQSLSIHNYLGNGGAIRAVAGARVTEFGFEATANELINANFSFDANEYFFNPIKITSSTRYVDWEDDDGVAAAAITARTYKDPHELAAALQSAMREQTSTAPTVTYSNTTGKYTIKATGTLLTLKWNTGTNTANSVASKIGFSTVADSSGTGATTGYTGAELSWVAPHSPTYDSADPVPGRGLEILIGDAASYLTLIPSSVSFSMQLERRVIDDLTSDNGRSGSIISGRTATLSVTALLPKHDAEVWRRLREGSDTRVQVAGGEKSGGQWVAGNCWYLYGASGVVSSWEVSDDDGLASIDFEITFYADASGNGEVYFGQL